MFDDFTVEENLLTSASLYPKPEARCRVDCVFDELRQCAFASAVRLRTPPRPTPKTHPFNLSVGKIFFEKGLAFGAALCHTGRMFFLDTPYTGADNAVTAQLAGLIQSQRSRLSSAFVIVEHKRQASDSSDANEFNFNQTNLEVL